MPPPDHPFAQWFADEVQPHEPILRAWLRSTFGERIDIDDIVQEAMVRLLRSREQGDVRTPKAFLFATARNLAVDATRRHHYSRTVPLVGSDVLNVLDEQSDVVAAVARNHDINLLTEAIQSLPDRCRQVFTLRKIYGLSQGEIAARMAISENTVSVQLTRGLHKITAYIAERRGGRDQLR